MTETEAKLRALVVAACDVAADDEASRLFVDAASAHGTTIISSGDLERRCVVALARLLRERDGKVRT